MDKRQLIDDIRRLNATATPKFLSQFDAKALHQYLQHLNEARMPRSADAVRVAPIQQHMMAQ